jgi:hypothetical protein
MSVEWETMATLYVLVYSFAMKYLALVVLVFVLLRADFIMNQIDRYRESSGPSVEVVPTDVQSSREVVSFKDDRTLKPGPREVFFILMTDFQGNPSPEVREKILAHAKENPSLFDEKLDPELEAAIFRLRDLLQQDNREVPLLILDLSKVLRGENAVTLKRFLSLLQDLNLESFIEYYPKAGDTNCLAAATFVDPVPQDEHLNQFHERVRGIDVYLQNEKIPESHRAFALNCQTVLNLEISKLAPKPSTIEESPVSP